MQAEMRCWLSTAGSPEYILPVVPSISVSPVTPYTCHCPVRLHHPCISVHQPSLSGSAKLSGGGGEKQIFPPKWDQYPHKFLLVYWLDCILDCDMTPVELILCFVRN